MHPVIAEQMATIILEDRRREALAHRTHGVPVTHTTRARLAAGLVALSRRLAPEATTEPATKGVPSAGHQLAGC